MGPVLGAKGPSAPAAGRRIEWQGILLGSLAFALVAYLGLEGGGYDPLVHDQVGIAIWWLVLLGVLIGDLPVRRPEKLAGWGLGLLAGFVAWTALSLGWTAAPDRTWIDLARVLTYLGVFALAVMLRGAKGARLVVTGVGAGVAVVAVVALLARMHPSWFSGVGQTALFLGGAQERLSFPLDYWNGLAALVAMGLPLLLQVASSARFGLTRLLAAAALPALMLTAFLTLSRGGIAAAALGLLAFLVCASDRLPKLATLVPAAIGGALLIAAAASRDAFRHGSTGAVGSSQGGEMLQLAILVCLAVGLVQLGGTAVLRRRGRPRWTVVPRRAAIAASVVAVVALSVAAVAIGGPSRAAGAWDEFKGEGGPGGGASRLASTAGENRYRYWAAAVDENGSRPLTGTGSGSFEQWWDRHGNGSRVRDAHSLYLQTLGELGIVGSALLAGFLLLVLVGGALRVFAAAPRARSQLAAALGAGVAFCLAAAFDWVWQIPALPVAFMLLAAVLLTSGRRSRHGTAPFPPGARVTTALAAIVAIVAIALPLAAASLLRSSAADARAGDLAAALGAARTAERVQPGGAEPHVQEALVLERLGRLEPAVAAARDAAARAPTAWRPWFVLARIYAERGDARAAVNAYRRARSLDPNSILFDPAS